MCDQQHSAVFPSADLLDDVEVFLDLQVAEALCSELHQLIDEATISEAQFNHLCSQREIKHTSLQSRSSTQYYVIRYYNII